MNYFQTKNQMFEDKIKHFEGTLIQEKNIAKLESEMRENAMEKV